LFFLVLCISERASELAASGRRSLLLSHEGGITGTMSISRVERAKALAEAGHEDDRLHVLFRWIRYQVGTE